MKRGNFLKTAGLGVAALALPGCTGIPRRPPAGGSVTPPNILFCISDDQSWLHAGAYGDSVVKTPNFDRIAREGVLFNHAYCAAPSCTPSRGGILTGQHIWRLEQGGNLWSTLPAKFPVYPGLLAGAGYHVGYTRKGWGPGQVEPGGRSANPAGPQYENFNQFLKEAPESVPWCFWFGSTDPHRDYDRGSGVAAGMRLDEVTVPPIWPDVPQVRSDVCDYYAEIQRFDREVGDMLRLLEQTGQMDNTLIVITSDNGMPFPRSKANLYDLGTRMPLAVFWNGRIPGGRVVDDFVSHTDVAPTFLEAAGLDPPGDMTGKSLMDILSTDRSGRVTPGRDHVVTARERHAWVRVDGLGYPSRALRTYDFLYIRNYEPDRWPAGDPPMYGDIDCRDLRYEAPTKEYLMRHRDDPAVQRLFEMSFGKRPTEELYDLRSDPHQMRNVAQEPEYRKARLELSARLKAYLEETGDPRATNQEPLWDSYPYYGSREFRPREGAPLPKQ
ncbi:MAG: sulfatase [Fidelibacterota bacterium]|nr:MAG: sulfatase [Candidatus Neomarinimicrobiota bacterium]